MKHRFTYFIIAASFILLILSCCSCDKDEAYRVLVIHSYEDTFNGYPHFNKLIEKQFAKRHCNVKIATLYLNCEGYSAKKEIDRMYGFMESISPWNPDIIIVNEDQATYSLLACDHPLVHKIPIVFGGVNYPNDVLLSKYTNVSGFRDRMNFIENFNVIKELTNNDNVFFLGDSTKLDLMMRSDLINTLKSANLCKDDVPTAKSSAEKYVDVWSSSFQITPNISIQRMKDFKYGRIDALLWRFSKYGSNMNYLQTKRDYTVYNISSMINSISFTAINDGFGCGEKLLGGYFTSVEIQVAEEVDLAVKILKGVAPPSTPIADSKKEYLLDWNVMRTHNIQLKDVPLNKYRIANIPLYNRYSTLFNSILSLLGLVLLTIIVFSLQRVSKETAEKKKLFNNLVFEKKLRSMVSIGSEVLSWRYEDNHFIFEDAFYQIMKYTVAPISVNKFLSNVHPDDRHIVIEDLDNFSKVKPNNIKQEIQHSQFRLNCNGSYEWWESRRMLSLGKNDSVMMIGIILNIQSHKDYEQDLENARDIADKAELKQSFLSNMSHEIRTPLNAIVGFSNLLTTPELFSDQERANFVQVINKNSTVMLKMIDDIIDLSSIEKGSVSFVFEQMSVNSILDQLYANFVESCPPGIKFSQKSYNGDIFVNVDKLRIIQALSCLVDNAFKFTNKGYVEIGASCDEQHEKVEFYVKDSGLGIDKSMYKVIFNRFFKQDEFQQGSGLGLPLCKIIVEEMKGTILVNSSPSVGSVFSVVLPIISQE